MCSWWSRCAPSLKNIVILNRKTITLIWRTSMMDKQRWRVSCNFKTIRPWFVGVLSHCWYTCLGNTWWKRKGVFVWFSVSTSEHAQSYMLLIFLKSSTHMQNHCGRKWQQLHGCSQEWMCMHRVTETKVRSSSFGASCSHVIWEPQFWE